MLRSVFKDYLILDDVFEFLNYYVSLKTSPQLLLKYSAEQRQVAVGKYGFREGKEGVMSYLQNENIVNHPNFFVYSREIQGFLAKNIKLKYYLRYEKRAAEKKLN